MEIIQSKNEQVYNNVQKSFIYFYIQKKFEKSFYLVKLFRKKVNCDQSSAVIRYERKTCTNICANICANKVKNIYLFTY